MIATTTSFTVDGVGVRPVTVEVDVVRGLPSFQIVGLPDTAVRESRERVRSAIGNSGFEFPLRRITASLAPADIRKAGPGLDLSIAVAILIASGQVPAECIHGRALAGELGLDGSVRPVPGALAMAQAAAEDGLRGLLIASDSGPEAALEGNLEVRCLSSLMELGAVAEGEDPGRIARPMSVEAARAGPDIRDLRGQPMLRKALEVAAAGDHGLLMVGPPGSGKSLAARRLPSILPALAGDELLEVMRVAGICGTAGRGIGRPFRSPHHTVSAAGLVGGGSPPRPGEITIAHCGVLFLDELCEFRRGSLEALREPLENGEVTISRASGSVTMPARFTLIAASNPCPCGRGPGDPGCSCSQAALERYAGRLSGALADRIDMTVSVVRPGHEAMTSAPGEGSEQVRTRVTSARLAMEARLGPGRGNGRATQAELGTFEVTGEAWDLLGEADRALSLSGRAHSRVIRVARTIADLEGSTEVHPEHVATALRLARRQVTG